MLFSRVPFKLLFTNLRRGRFATLFALTGIALAVATIVALLSVSRGMLHQFKRLTADYRGDIVVLSKGAPDPGFSHLDADIVDTLREVAGVERVTPIVHYAMRVRYGDLEELPVQPDDKRQVFIMFAMPANSELLKRHALLRGRYFSSAKQEVIIGEAAAEKFRINIGDSFPMRTSSYTVVGVFRTKIRILDQSIIYSTDNFFQDFKTRKVNVVSLDVADGDYTTREIIRTINQKFPELEAVPSAEVLNFMEHLKLFERFMLGIAIIAVTIAILGILNTMMMSVYERTRELGLLRVVGWSTTMIFWMILGEGLLLALFGGVAGILIGIGATEGLIDLIDIGIVQAQYSNELILKALALSALVGVCGSVIPGIKAIRISPVEALRYE